jgi:hypothetical protein
MAPEQTGRMNRATDSRADLYSFGVTTGFTGRRRSYTDILSIVTLTRRGHQRLTPST